MVGEPGATAHVRDSGPGSLKVAIAVAGQSFAGDEPLSAGGTGCGPAPHDLLAAGLAECTALTLRLYADRKGWPLTAIEVEVVHERDSQASPSDLFRRTVRLTGDLNAEQRARLLEIAERCPVHRTLTAGSRIETLRGLDVSQRSGPV
jgi:putative redox protein